MKERSVLFSGSMVRAILEGRKTQTRRVMKPQPIYDPQATEHYHGFGDKKGAWIWTPREKTYWFCWDGWSGFDLRIYRDCPYGQPDDRLWVRETWATGYETMHCKPSDIPPGTYIEYKATPTENTPYFYKWRPSIFMPRWASRIMLGIAAVRVERLQDISEEDAKAEGVSPWHGTVDGTVYKPEFISLWDSINSKRPGYSWGDNPYVWVIEFERVL